MCVCSDDDDDDDGDTGAAAFQAKLEEAVYKEQELSEQQGLQSARATKVIQVMAVQYVSVLNTSI